MNNKAIYFFLVPFILFSCGKKTNFTISGQIDGGEGKMIYLNKLLTNSQIPFDSVRLDRAGKFRFKGRTSSPAFYLLKISANNFITLLIDSTENCLITGPYKGFTNNCKIKGSIGSQILEDLNSRFSNAKMQLDSLHGIMNNYKNKPLFTSKMNELQARCNGIMTDHSNYVTGFVKKNPFSLVCVYALYQKWDDNHFVINDLQTMKVAASALYSVYPGNEQVVALYQNTLEIVRQEARKKLNDVITDNAVNSPNIILPDVDGKEKELWSLHGKYVLLNFWSAKDAASRTLNPVISEIYHKYRKRGFEIFMVSVDTDRAAWMGAIEDDNLTCINVGDMKGCFQAVTNYNIQELPYNYLLDKEGRILAKNLKGPAIDQVLSQLLK
jgi:peroxiredoxin